jgi:hypothetical protein
MKNYANSKGVNLGKSISKQQIFDKIKSQLTRSGRQSMGGRSPSPPNKIHIIVTSKNKVIDSFNMNYDLSLKTSDIVAESMLRIPEDIIDDMDYISVIHDGNILDRNDIMGNIMLTKKGLEVEITLNSSSSPKRVKEKEGRGSSPGRVREKEGRRSSLGDKILVNVFVKNKNINQFHIQYSPSLKVRDVIASVWSRFTDDIFDDVDNIYILYDGNVMKRNDTIVNIRGQKILEAIVTMKDHNVVPPSKQIDISRSRVVSSEHDAGKYMNGSSYDPIYKSNGDDDWIPPDWVSRSGEIMHGTIIIKTFKGKSILFRFLGNETVGEIKVRLSYEYPHLFPEEILVDEEADPNMIALVSYGIELTDEMYIPSRMEMIFLIIRYYVPKPTKR